MPKLHFPQPEFTTHSCDLPEGKTTVGRSSRNSLVLSDPSVSADHGELVVSWNEVIVRDHGSSNGTWVAGVRVNAGGQLPVNHGAVIRFGRVEARLELDGGPDDEATAATANFGVSRTAQAQPDPEPQRVIAGDGPLAPEGGETTVSLPAPARPVPPTVIVTAEPLRPRPASRAGRPSHGWLVVLLVMAAAVIVFWLLRRFR